jgi:hypothetical protein
MPNDVYFDSGLEGWIKRTARENYWRVSKWYELQDLVQDGYLCYLKCRNKYAMCEPDPGAQKLNVWTHPSNGQRKHFMALVKRTFFNHIMTLSSDFAAMSVEESECDLEPRADGQPVLVEELAPVEAEELSVFIAVKNAPAEIGEAIKALVDDGDEYLRSRLRRRDERVVRKRRKLRETTDERLARVTGSPDLPNKIVSYLLS